MTTTGERLATPEGDVNLGMESRLSVVRSSIPTNKGFRIMVLASRSSVLCTREASGCRIRVARPHAASPLRLSLQSKTASRHLLHLSVHSQVRRGARSAALRAYSCHTTATFWDNHGNRRVKDD